MLRLAPLAAALAAAAALFLPFAAPAQPASGAAHDEHAEHVSSAGALRLVHAWSRAVERGEALVFLEIENGGEGPATLTGGETEVAESVEVVGFRLGAGEGAYVPLGDLPIAPGGVMKLGPEGVALRLNGLKRPLRRGETFALGIAFAGTHVDVTVEVGAADAVRHSHAGHRH